MEYEKRVLIVVGTRPNFIKITQFERVLSSHGRFFDYKLVHTGQHYDDNMSKVFFEQLNLRKPDTYLNISDPSPGKQIGHIIIRLSDVMEEMKPDLVIVVGDVNSTLAAAVAANKLNIPVAHLESGLRSYDSTMPEEHNRMVADALAEMYFVTEQSGIDNLKEEGKGEDSVHFVGNTMIDTLIAFDPKIQQNDICRNLKVRQGKFVLMTMHRPGNVDKKEDLEKLIKLMEMVTENFHIVFPIHPRTSKKIEEYGFKKRVENNDKIILTPPLDYFAFQKLVSDCKFVLTDSGGIQEETTYRQVPCITVRPNTERPSTITMGTNTLVDFNLDKLQELIQTVINGSYKKGKIPPMWDGRATERIVEIIKGAI